MTAQNTARRRIAAIAASMIEGQVELLEGCREVVRIRGALVEPDLDDPDLLVLVAVDSELDDVPTGLSRRQWEPAALTAKDVQRDDYLKAAAERLLDACRALAAKWGR